jgi:metallo-beta-lactamase family protein
MHVTFYGATREVTGSFHTVTTDSDVILLDCGLFQGKRKEAEAKNRVLPIDPKVITNVVLSHAHIDHSGRMPLITKEDFNGHVFCTRATAHACEYLLKDSAKIQEGDASYLNYKTAKHFLAKTKSGNNKKKISKADFKEIQALLKSGPHRLKTEAIEKLLRENQLVIVSPLYTMETAGESLDYFNGVPYELTVTIGNDLTCTFYDAGHILGSAMSVMQYKKGDETKTVMYSGDVGRFDKPIIQDPTLDFAEEHRDIDLMIMESTYGNRLHDPVIDMKPLLKKVIIETFDRGGSVIIPSFSYGRTQELIYYLHELYLAGEVPRRPVYVDSPLAVNVTDIFRAHPECYDEELREYMIDDPNPFGFERLTYIRDVADSKKLNTSRLPMVIISASGMCEAGRILHHLRNNISDPRNTIMMVGFCAAHTLGRRIVEQRPEVKIFGEPHRLRAQVEVMNSYSAHADEPELVEFVGHLDAERLKKIFLVHGDPDRQEALGLALTAAGYMPSVAPKRGESFEL